VVVEVEEAEMDVGEEPAMGGDSVKRGLATWIRMWSLFGIAVHRPASNIREDARLEDTRLKTGELGKSFAPGKRGSFSDG